MLNIFIKNLNFSLLQFLFVRLSRAEIKEILPIGNYDIWYLIVAIPFTGYFNIPLVYLGSARQFQIVDYKNHYASEDECSFWLLKFDTLCLAERKLLIKEREFSQALLAKESVADNN